MRVILATGRQADNYFDFLTGFIKTTLKELYINFRDIDPTGPIDRVQLIKSFIQDHINQDVLVSGWMNNVDRYNEIKNELSAINVSIESVYIKNDESYDKLTDTEKENIEVHSRWTGETVEELEYIQNQNNQKLQEMATAIEQDGVNVIWID